MNRSPVRIINTQDKDLLQIRFFPTDFCNYSCSYCFSDLQNKNRYPKNTDLVINNFRRIFDFYHKNFNKTKIQLIISGGGEPTLWPDLERFCKELKESHNVIIQLISNGSRTIRWWDKTSYYFDSVVLSCHNEFVDIDHYIEVADTLFKNDIKVTGLCVMDARYWDLCISNIEKMKSSKYPWFIEAKPVVDSPGMGMDIYSKDQLSYLNNSIKRLPDASWLLKRLEDLRLHESVILFDDGSVELAKSQTLIVNKWNNFKNWICSVALETLVINSDGMITGSCHVNIIDDKIFNVFSETFILDFDDNIKLLELKCPKNICSCSSETHVSKSIN